VEDDRDREIGMRGTTPTTDPARDTVYFVNGERQKTAGDELSVSDILTRAGFEPADQYELIRDHPHHVFANLDEVVKLHQDERFTAIFHGPTPTS
jgi:hypothetical protein